MSVDLWRYEDDLEYRARVDERYTNEMHKSTGDLALTRWRIGRKLGRTIYAMVGDEPSDDDTLIGMMDHESIAAIAVLQHNNALKELEK